MFTDDQVLQRFLPCNVQLFGPVRTHQHCYYSRFWFLPGCYSLLAHIEVTSVCIGGYHQNVQQNLSLKCQPKIEMLKLIFLGALTLFPRGEKPTDSKFALIWFLIKVNFDLKALSQN